MNHHVLISRIVGSLFYFSPSHPNNQLIIDELVQAEYADGFPELQALLDSLATVYREAQDGAEELEQDFAHLFEGMGKMPAPPWGSVYLDSEQTLFGESTLRFKAFLRHQQLCIDSEQHEPEDQFGLMLLSLSMLQEREDGTEAVQTLLQLHLLPWALAYLSLVKKHAKTQFYQSLAAFTEHWCCALQAEFNIQPEPMAINLPEYGASLDFERE